MNLWGRKCSPCPTPPPSWLLPSDNFLIRVYFLLLSHMSFLSKFQILIPFQIYDLQICFFILQVVFLLMVSFSVQRLFSLRYSHLLIFAFDTFALGVKKKNGCQNQCQGAYFLCFLLGVLWLQDLDSSPVSYFYIQLSKFSGAIY